MILIGIAIHRWRHHRILVWLPQHHNRHFFRQDGNHALAQPIIFCGILLIPRLCSERIDLRMVPAAVVPALITGEEIIARFEEETTEHVKVSRPLAVTLGPQGLGMIPFMFLAEKETFKIKHSHILVSGPAKKDAGPETRI